MKRKKIDYALIVVLLLATLFVLNTNLFTVQAANYTLTVDAGQKGATWNRFYEKCVACDHADTILNSAWGVNAAGALKKGHDEAGFQYVRFHGIFDSDIGVYNTDNGVYNWTNFDRVYDTIVAAGMKPVLEISFTPPGLASNTSSTLHWYGGSPANISMPKDWTKWQALMKALVQHVEGRYGASEVQNNWRFEVWNEPDWMLSGGFTNYLTLYNYTSKGLIQGDPNVKIGGPAQSGPSSEGSIGSLISYCKTNGLKLDFVSYHRYANDSGYSGSILNANTFAQFQQGILNVCSSNGFTGELILDEFGPTYSMDTSHDNEMAASFMAKTIHLLGTTVTPPSMFAHWTISDIYEEVDTGSNTAFTGNYGLLLKGDSRYADSADVAKPAFNTLKLLHKMGDIRISCTGGTTSDGVNAVATISNDGNSVQILVYNHVNSNTGNSANYDTVTLNVNNLPFTPGNVQVEHYVVDRTRSNAYYSWVNMGKPAQPSQSQWTTLKAASQLANQDPVTTVALSGKTWSKTFNQNVYSVGLIILTKSNSTVTPTPTSRQSLTATPTPTTRITPTPTQNQTGNLAQGKTASADSSESANPPANGNDGNTSTRWCAADGNLNHWWKVDLGQNYNLTGSEVTWESAANYKYRIETSTDNTTWTVRSDKTANTNTAQVQSDSFTANARYVRITVTGLASGRWASFFEFKVFGSGGTATPTPSSTATPTTRTATPIPTQGTNVTKYEAENAALSGGAMVATDHTGYSGSGFVAGYYGTGTGQTVTFTVNITVPGSHNFTLRYSNAIGSAQNISIYVDGAHTRDSSCANLASWDTWSNQVETLVLAPGTHTIAYKKDTGDGCLNLDYLTVD